jgi:putative transcriptional regulator
MTIIVAKTRATDGKVVRVYPDGREKVLKIPPMRKMTQAQIEKAAREDPDNPPLTATQLAKMRRVSPVKRLRWSLGLSQEKFAARYQIPLGTLRDWEQGRSEPDAPARAYLKVIAGDSKGVERVLKSSAAR